jgi:23S rRNA G2069 N7-methylase RlmK/C1962 C5-methylase RlmI
MPEKIESEDLYFATKPNGVATHRPSPEHLGFVEWLEEQTQLKLKVCQRLDKETSGAMVFAKNKEAAQKLTELFTSRQITKEYLLVSPQKSPFKEWLVVETKNRGTLIKECPGQIEEEGDVSLTQFIRMNESGTYYLYKAFPQTGKTHQIRKHASHSEIPILGDTLYGGKNFPRLMLHCFKLVVPWRGKELGWEVPPSPLFEDLNLCKDPQLCVWIDSFERRKTLFPEMLNGHNSLRVFHNETGDLRGEQFGSRMVLGWWKKEKPTDKEKNKIQKLMTHLDVKDWVFQWRPGAQDHGSTAELLHSEVYDENDWVFYESDVAYQGRMNQGQNVGLFLDQRDRRQWLRKNCKNLKVLNLFAYTCGFSVNAALGGAQKVVSVDLSTKYLEWGKDNFRQNQLNPEEPHYEWRCMDSMEYLKYAQKKGFRFDRIVCDPPSFSRHKKSKRTFQVEKDFQVLLELCSQCLEPGGLVLFSTNYEKWDLDKWVQKLSAASTSHGLKLISSSPSQWDFEWQKQVANLKAFFLEKA